MTFLSIPIEIRDRIYTYLLVDVDKYSAGVNPKLNREGIGGVLVQELYPGYYRPSMRRTSYLTRDWDIIHHQERRTTYKLDAYEWDVDLQLFYTCRQIYEEASYIFYVKNRFYIDTIDSLVPFLEDRPLRARKLIRTISIPIPYGRQDDDGEAIPRAANVKESTFESAREYMANHPQMAPNLTQLDIRVRDYTKELDLSLSQLDLDNVRLGDKIITQLASIAHPRIMTFSFFDWHHAALDGPILQSLFEALPGHIYCEIEEARKSLSIGTIPTEKN